MNYLVTPISAIGKKQITPEDIIKLLSKARFINQTGKILRETPHDMRGSIFSASQESCAGRYSISQ